MARGTWYAALFLIFHSQLQAQQLRRQEIPTPISSRTVSPRFDYLALEDGLSQGAVSDILQDRHGFMWFTTQDGLNRWDGHEFKVYYHQPYDSTTLSSSWLTTIAEDPDGSLWIGTEYDGLNRMDVAAEKFTHFQHDPSDSTSLADGWVRDILVEPDGRLWVATDQGLSMREPGGGTTFRTFRHDPDDPTTLSSPVQLSLFRDSDGRLWIGSAHGLSRLESIEDGTFSRFLMEPDPAGCAFGSPTWSSIVGGLSP